MSGHGSRIARKPQQSTGFGPMPKPELQNGSHLISRQALMLPSPVMRAETVLRLLEAGMFGPLEMRSASNDLTKYAEMHIAISSDIREICSRTCSDVQDAGAGPPLSILSRSASPTLASVPDDCVCKHPPGGMAVLESLPRLT
ncbi:hypothetical protein V2G26_008695 [Clonostachys chloroleuca]